MHTQRCTDIAVSSSSETCSAIRVRDKLISKMVHINATTKRREIYLNYVTNGAMVKGKYIIGGVKLGNQRLRYG